MNRRERFKALWRRVFAASAPDAAYGILDSGYADPRRTYHNWSHIEAMLDGLDTAQSVAEFSRTARDEIELAIWFHDTIYDPMAQDNEAKSADLFRQLAGSEPSAGLIQRISDMILATALHGPTDNADTRLLLDLDLMVLGAQPAEYQAYVDRVRLEYSAVPDEAWRIGRPAVLQRFLERPTIYQTADFREKLERAARQNIRGEIARLVQD